MTDKRKDEEHKPIRPQPLDEGGGTGNPPAPPPPPSPPPPQDPGPL